MKLTLHEKYGRELEINGNKVNLVLHYQKNKEMLLGLWENPQKLLVYLQIYSRSYLDSWVMFSVLQLSIILFREC